MADDIEDYSRARRLKAATHDAHSRLDTSVMAAKPFDSVEGYGRFVQMQWAFHRDIDALYDSADLQSLLPGLSARRSLEAIEADLADLKLAPPQIDEAPAFRANEIIDLPTALGWLYVAEGSNMGAALLRKEAAKLGLSDDHGARHLAPADEGPAAHWRAFTGALDHAELTPEEDERMMSGARAAFERVQMLADRCLAPTG